MLTEEYEFNLNGFCCLCHRVSMCECIWSGDMLLRLDGSSPSDDDEYDDDVVARGDEEGQGGAHTTGLGTGSADDTSFDRPNVSIT